MRRGGAVVCLAVSLLAGVVGVGKAQAPRKLSKAEALDAVATKVAPVYPPVAKQLKIEGVVELEAVVGENGQVEAVNIVSGNPVLTKPSTEALRKWKFTPQTQDGKAVRFIAPIALSFKM